MVGDLVYADPDGEELGVLSGYTLDMAWGIDENDFELKTGTSPLLACGTRIYFDGTEWGGIVDSRTVDETGDVPEVSYSGRTWHGVLAGMVVCPDVGASHLAYSGDANAVLLGLVQRLGLTGLFTVPETSVGDISGEFPRFGDAWTCAKLALAPAGLRPNLEKVPGGKVELSAVSVSDYRGAFWSDQFSLKVAEEMRPVNHLVCLGEGTLDKRTVAHWYADASGNVSQAQTLSGTDERAEVYEGSGDSFEADCRERLEELQAEGSSVDLEAADSIGAHVGDWVGAASVTTGAQSTGKVNKVILNVGERGAVTVKYQVGPLVEESEEPA